LFGANLADKATAQMLGSCLPMPANMNTCPGQNILKEVVNQATGQKEKQCCTLATPAVCEPKCRPIPTEGCKANEGEIANNNQCCYSVEDPKSKQEKPLKECSICRLRRADVGGKCNQDEFETEVENAEGKKIKICCQARASSYVYQDCRWKGTSEFNCPKEEVQNKYHPEQCCQKETLSCCSSVLECVNRKFSSSLDGLADMFSRGSVPLNSLLK